MSEEYPTLPFTAVFWQGPDAEDGVNAVVHVEDALVLYLTRPDGLQVRLTVNELDLLYSFVMGEVFRQEERIPVYGRMEGCESSNHTECYGQLWHCVACGKTVCYAEGSDHKHEVCDDCWAMEHLESTSYNPLDDDIPF
jgi:hypothetical protein